VGELAKNWPRQIAFTVVLAIVEDVAELWPSDEPQRMHSHQDLEFKCRIDVTCPLLGVFLRLH
jgi:hypothetical protein